jgi:hypothetical protein
MANVPNLSKKKISNEKSSFWPGVYENVKKKSPNLDKEDKLCA